MTAAVQSDQLPDLPYPGIEPFDYARRKVFFARDKEACSLMQLIAMYRGVLLYSDSGTGKSSLVNAGLIPLAIDRGFQPERIRVQPRRGEEIIVERLSERVDDKRPFLPSIFASDEQHERVVVSVEEFEKTLRQPALAARPLLVFDQFEEWITLFEEGSRGETANDARIAQKSIREAIVSLINDRKLRVKVLIVLREDYLAKLDPLFEQCPSLPDQYLRLTALGGDQIYRAICGPFEEHPGRYRVEVSPTLAKNIRAQFEERSEGADVHLTEVQIVCRSLFEAGRRGQKIDEYFTDEGGVQGILERYLELALESLNIDQQEPAVALLTRMLTSAGTRNVISEDDLLNRVENEDRIPRELLGKALVNLEQETKLVRRERRRDVYYYEIASEFLVGWVRRKAQERQQLAKRRELEERAEVQARTNKRLYRVLALLVVVLLLLVGFSYLYYDWKIREHISYYNAYVKRWGIPEGIGRRLTRRQVQRRAASLKFTTKGQGGQLLKMEVVDSWGKLTPKHGVHTHFEFETDEIPYREECRWEYVLDSEGHVVYEKAYDRHGKLFFGVVYSPPTEGNKETREAVRLGLSNPQETIRGEERSGEGLVPEPSRGLVFTEARILSIDYDDQGYEICIRYLDPNRNRIWGPDKAFGRKHKFDANGLITEMTSLDRNDEPMNDECGNATIRMTYDKLGNAVRRVAFDASGKKTIVKDGWAEVSSKYDSVGNLIEKTFFGIDGNPALTVDGYASWKAKYDDRGNPIRFAFFGADGKPCSTKHGYAAFEAEYDAVGQLIRKRYYNEKSQPID